MTDLLRYDSGAVNKLTVAFESPVLYANRSFEHHRKSLYTVPPETLPENMRGENHANFIRCSLRPDFVRIFLAVFTDFYVLEQKK